MIFIAAGRKFLFRVRARVLYHTAAKKYFVMHCLHFSLGITRNAAAARGKKCNAVVVVRADAVIRACALLRTWKSICV